VEGPKAEGLARLLREMAEVERKVTDAHFDPPRLAVLQGTMEALRRRIDAGYDYHKVRSSIRPDLATVPENVAATP